ncbi:hypothetical protein CANCADRAFT_46606 [Tortispora caseinolytica NRRL Y-17796]|uniref:Major facilitator superfamily (MFS) profile domain-containing protein n=1 Tax=Tortispora caseinolytica NRRL Y-17796 TaxID=767744 RepID=A0A1E4TIJ4_9ASCO|nr:hypothetical protein CANCADRAFT_46606 [Tortispora caseinolytica NRRL Y-17796]
MAAVIELSRTISQTFTNPHAEKIIDLADLQYDGPDDPANPRNWSRAYKWYITISAGFMFLAVTFGSSVYVSGSVEIMYEMHVSRTVSLLGLTLYLFGLSAGPMLGAPVSEILGREIVYLSSMPCAILFNVGIAQANNIGTILVCRFFAGVFASPVMAISSGTMVDLWDDKDIGKAACIFGLMPFTGPVIGPLIGGFVVTRKDWRWTSYVQMMFMGVAWFLMLFCKETYKNAILTRKYKKLGYKIRRPAGGTKVLVNVLLKRPALMMVAEPTVGLFSLYSSFIFAVLFAYFEAIPFIFQTVYDFNLEQIGLTFIGIGVGLVLGLFVFILTDVFSYSKLPPEEVTPELRLLGAIIGAPLIPIGLFWLGWSSRPSVHWISPVLSGLAFGAGLVLVFMSIVTYFAYAYSPLVSASAMAANNFERYIFAGVFPLFTIQMYENLGIDWACSLFGFLSIAMIPIPWLFRLYGKKLRSKSLFNDIDSADVKKDEESGNERSSEFDQSNDLRPSQTRASMASILDADYTHLINEELSQDDELRRTNTLRNSRL